MRKRQGGINITDLVKLIVELLKLGSFRHNFFIHHERRLNLLVSTLSQKVKAVRDESLIKIDTIVSEEVTSMTANFCAYEEGRANETS